MNNLSEYNNILLCFLGCRAKIYSLTVSITKIMLTLFVLRALGKASAQDPHVYQRGLRAAPMDCLLFQQCIMIMSVTVFLDKVFCD